jgi:hypothetical protein
MKVTTILVPSSLGAAKMKPEEVKPVLAREPDCAPELMIPAHEVGAIIKAAMLSERKMSLARFRKRAGIDLEEAKLEVYAWECKAEKLEAM